MEQQGADAAEVKRKTVSVIGMPRIFLVPCARQKLTTAITPANK